MESFAVQTRQALRVSCISSRSTIYIATRAPVRRADQDREGLIAGLGRTRLTIGVNRANGRDGEEFRLPARGDLFRRIEGRRPKVPQEGTRGAGRGPRTLMVPQPMFIPHEETKIQDCVVIVIIM
jgi:hypothetical protein